MYFHGQNKRTDSGQHNVLRTCKKFTIQICPVKYAKNNTSIIDFFMLMESE